MDGIYTQQHLQLTYIVTHSAHIHSNTFITEKNGSYISYTLISFLF